DALVRTQAEVAASRAALARSEKLRAMGEMAAGISHDLRNILNPLALQVQLLQRRLRGVEGAGETLEAMRDAIRAGVEVTERLRAFGRQAREAPDEALDLAAV